MKDEIRKRKIEREEYIPFDAGDELLGNLIDDMTQAEENIKGLDKQIKPLKDDLKEQQKLSDDARYKITKGKPVKCLIEEVFNFTKGKVNCLNTETMKSYTRDLTEEDHQLDCFDEVVEDEKTEKEESKEEVEEKEVTKKEGWQEPLPLGKKEFEFLIRLAEKYDIIEQAQFIADDFNIQFASIINPENEKDVAWLLNQIPNIEEITKPEDVDICSGCKFENDPQQCTKECKDVDKNICVSKEVIDG